MIKIVETDEDILSTFDVMSQLRPHLRKENYVKMVRDIQNQSTYKLVCVRDHNEVYSVAGYRISQSLAWGTFLYVDDFVTNENVRSKGHGKTLFNWLKEEAKANRCDQLHLDSGVQRHAAHRFYLRERMDIKSYHFSEPL